MSCERTKLDVDAWAYQRQFKQSRSTREELVASFRKQARWYDRKLSAFLPPDRGAAILDLACGEGRFLWYLTHKGYRNAQGLDLDAGRVATARALGLNATASDCLTAIQEHARDSLDMVACLDFLEHLEKAEAVRFLIETYRALKPRGVLLIRMPCADGFFGARDWCNDMTHKWAATSGVLGGTLRSVGFGDVRILDERPVPYKMANVLRLGGFHIAKAVASLFLLALGVGAPRVWSTSMWAVCRK